MVWEICRVICKRMKLDHFLTLFTKINLKWTKDLNVRPETIELLEENIGSMLFDISLRYIFLDISPQAWEAKAKINKWDCIKLKGFCTVKETINKTKRQLTEREKIFATDISDKGFISQIYKDIQRTHTTQCQKNKQKQTTTTKNQPN